MHVRPRTLATARRDVRSGGAAGVPSGTAPDLDRTGPSDTVAVVRVGDHDDAAQLADPVVHLDLPAAAEVARIVRLVGAALLADLDATVDDTDRMGIAVDELVAALTDVASDRLTVTLDAREGLRCEARCPASAEPALDAATRGLLARLGVAITAGYDGRQACVEVVVPSRASAMPGSAESSV